MLLGEILRRDPHVDVVNRVFEAFGEEVRRRLGAEPRSPAHVVDNEGHAAHVLHAACGHDPAFAQEDLLVAADDGLHPGCALALDRHARNTEGKSRLEENSPGDVELVRAHHAAAHDDLVHLLRLDSRS